MRIKLVLMGMVSLLSLTSCNGVTASGEGPLARRGVRVLDETGLPMKGVPVSMSFGHDVPTVTNEEGIAVAEGQTRDGVGFLIDLDGYYRSHGHLPNSKSVKLGRWQPWGAINDVMVRKIENPISMYAVKKIKVEIPELEQPCGYDLFKGDWVAPWGEGEHPDIIFEAVSETRKPLDYYRRLTIRFNSEHDGLIVAEHPKAPRNYSQFVMDRYAPRGGYLSEYIIERHRTETEVFKPGNLDFGYYFRVRTTMNEDGEIEESYYGKIKEPFKIMPAGKDLGRIAVRFGYYLNPNSNDRNLEFKKGSSLFEGTGIYSDREINEAHLEP